MEQPFTNAVEHQTAAFFSLVNHPIKFRLYLLQKLPAAFLSGVKVVSADSETCVATVPFRWFTQNPFRSTYFACLSMAAELSTGVLALAHVYRRKPSVSLLITGMEGKFYKKAQGTTVFTCTDGSAIREAILSCINTGTPREVKVRAAGKNDSGETVAEFWFTWSFKVR